MELLFVGLQRRFTGSLVFLLQRKRSGFLFRSVVFLFLDDPMPTSINFWGCQYKLHEYNTARPYAKLETQFCLC